MNINKVSSDISDTSGGGKNMSKVLNIEFDMSKHGIPCLWEYGGGYSNTGKAGIITDSIGNPKKALYIKAKGTLACDTHALIPISVGDYVIRASHHRKDFNIEIYRVKHIIELNKLISMVRVSEFSMGEWSVDEEFNNDHHLNLMNAVEAAKNKAMDYHCREPYYVIKP